MPSPLVAKKYSIESHTLRYFKTSYITDKNFVNLDQAQLSSEPQLFILLKQNKVKQVNLNRKYKELPLNILVIEVNSKNLFESNAKELKALKSIYKTSEEITNDPIAKKEISDQIDHLERRLISALKGITHSTDYIWMHDAKKLKIRLLYGHPDSPKQHSSRYLSPITNVLRNELINRDNISAQGQSARTNLIKMMASQRHDPELGYASDKFPPDKTIFNAVFKQSRAISKRFKLVINLLTRKKVRLFILHIEFIKNSLSSRSQSLMLNYARVCLCLLLESKKACILLFFLDFIIR